MSATLVALLKTPSRRRTVLPELVEFFGKDADQLLAFLRRFGGATLKVPGPSLWADLHKDREMVEALQKDDSVRIRIALCKKYKTTPSYLAELYRTVMSRPLSEVPHDGTKGGRIAAAHRAMTENPGSDKIVRQLFGLEKAKV